MTRFVNPVNRSRFEEAFVVTRYLLGRRGQELREHFAPTTQGTKSLLDALDSDQRQARATALAQPLARILSAAQRGGVQ